MKLESFKLSGQLQDLSWEETSHNMTACRYKFAKRSTFVMNNLYAIADYLRSVYTFNEIVHKLLFILASNKYFCF